MAAQYRSGTIAEIGTGCGVGTAWILSGLDPRVRLVTIELDEDRAAVASRLLEPAPNVRVLRGDWRQVLELAPFEMVFCDASSAKREEPEFVLRMMRPGGLVVLDDFTPEAVWTPEQKAALGHGDPVRGFWLGDSRLIGVEVMVTTNHAVILAVRR